MIQVDSLKPELFGVVIVSSLWLFALIEIRSRRIMLDLNWS